MKRMLRPESMAKRPQLAQSMARPQGPGLMDCTVAVPIHNCSMLRQRQGDSLCDGCGRRGTVLRCAEGCNFDLCGKCFDESYKVIHNHPMRKQEMPGNVCDVPRCGAAGTSFRCSQGCDFDVCGGCWRHYNSAPSKSEVAEVHMDVDAAFRVVRREAELRLSTEYIEKTRPYAQRGQVPPVEFDQAVQRQALVESGRRRGHRAALPGHSEWPPRRPSARGLFFARQRHVLPS